MFRTVLAAALTAAAMPAHAGVFDGTWKADLATAKYTARPIVRLLAGGVYRCPTCTPPAITKADGAFHPVKGDPYTDMRAVRVVDAHSVTSQSKKNGKLAYETSYTVSPDGKSLKYSWTDHTGPKGDVTGEGTDTRMKAGPAGSHAISGSWNPGVATNISDNAIIATFVDKGDTLAFSSPAGQAFDARFGGPFVKIANDPAGTLASVKRAGPRTMIETDKRGGKIVAVTRYMLAADGKSIAMTSEDKEAGGMLHATLNKQ